MAQAADITIERNYRGTPTYVKFNYKKYGTLLNSFCIANGIDFPAVDIPNATTIKAIKDAHQGKGKAFSNVDDFLADLYK